MTQPAVTWPKVDLYRVRETARRLGARFEAERAAAVAEQNRLAVANGATVCTSMDECTRKPCERLAAGFYVAGWLCPKHAPPAPVHASSPRATVERRRHVYGPHNPAGTPPTVKVLTASKPHFTIEQPLPAALVKQRADLNRLAHERSSTP